MSDPVRKSGGKMQMIWHSIAAKFFLELHEEQRTLQALVVGKAAARSEECSRGF